MKKIFKMLLTGLMSIAILLTGTIAVSAYDGSQEIMPRLDVALRKTFTFTVSDTNQATVTVRYAADSSVFERANLTVKLEKRFSLLFWITVDIGYTNNELKVFSTNPNGVYSNTFIVNGTGMYRAHITLEVIGSNGQKDVIEETLEYEYK